VRRPTRTDAKLMSRVQPRVVVFDKKDYLQQMIVPQMCHRL
jgi:pantothenate synthetase